MTLQEAIDNAPEWARWLGVDENGEDGAYFDIKPTLSFGCFEAYGCIYKNVEITGQQSGPQLIEVNK